MPDFPRFGLLACTPLTLPIFSGVLFLLLCDFSFLYCYLSTTFYGKKKKKKKTDLASAASQGETLFPSVGTLLIGCLVHLWIICPFLSHYSCCMQLLAAPLV